MEPRNLAQTALTPPACIAMAMAAGCGQDTASGQAATESAASNASESAGAIELSAAQIDDLVRRSCQYVAMYNVNNKSALSQGGWNTCAADGAPPNAMNDYVIRTSKDELPPADAFWSLTLCDLDQGFFIPNDRRKYSVAENGGMAPDADGGIAIYVAAEKPEGLPDANWLPIERKDLGLSLILRIYVPDLEAMNTWKPPVAEKL